jgi:hypothetical protein
MGIQDRDYMKRPSDDGAERAASPEAKVEAFFRGVLRRHPRLPVALGVALVVLIVAAILVARLSGNGR